jgi:hypothetical protein
VLLPPPTFDFAFVSDLAEGLDFEPLAEVDSGLSTIEEVRKDLDAWNTGQVAGNLTLKIDRTANPSVAHRTADFDLDDGDSVRLEGKGELRVAGDLTSLFRGRLVETVGTGKFSGRHRVIWLRVRNPKRWGFDEAP